MQLDGRTVVGLRLQLGVSPALGGAEHGVGQLQHLRGRAVVAHQANGLCAGVLGGELAQVSWRGTGEGVDRLRRVADHTHVASVADPQIEQGLLDEVDVLVLVDHEVAVLLADGARHVIPLDQEAGHEQQDVLEVDHVAPRLHVLVHLPQTRHRDVVEVGDIAPRLGRVPRVRLGGEHADLGPLDLGGDVADRHPIQLQP